MTMERIWERKATNGGGAACHATRYPLELIRLVSFADGETVDGKGTTTSSRARLFLDFHSVHEIALFVSNRQLLDTNHECRTEIINALLRLLKESEA